MMRRAPPALSASEYACARSLYRLQRRYATAEYEMLFAAIRLPPFPRAASASVSSPFLLFFFLLFSSFRAMPCHTRGCQSDNTLMARCYSCYAAMFCRAAAGEDRRGDCFRAPAPALARGNSAKVRLRHGASSARGDAICRYGAFARRRREAEK